MGLNGKLNSILLSLIIPILIFSTHIYCNENSEDPLNGKDISNENDEIIYLTPKVSSNVYAFESLDDEESFKNTWVKSQMKKDDIDENIAKYDGIWELEPAIKDALLGDKGLVLKSKAKHAAISFKLRKPFSFQDKPLVVQYEVHLQNGQECGGAYIKLLSSPKGNIDLKHFNDKTPYTIMFGPDKCGSDHKLHFIFRHVNPLNKAIEEKHCKKPKSKLDTPFNDKRPHLYTLIVQPGNTFEILLDHEVINSGHLLEDFTPPVNPPKEIDDPKDLKPNDWDERDRILDPTAVKPEDWDEDAPRQIIDEYATKPDGWLEDEPEYISDPASEKPEDWDNEMDGEWEAPLIANPKCEGAPGCGKWSQPMIDNPSFKGKWKPPMVDNPNYKGKWTPRKIANPDYFDDLEPFKMTPIAAVGLELWSMSDEIYFDNFLVTDNVEQARLIASETFDLKIMKIDKGQVGMIKKIMNYSNDHPWMYGVYVIVLAIPIVIIFICCCGEESKTDKDAMQKKTDAPTEDDPARQEESKNNENGTGNKSEEEELENHEEEVCEEEHAEEVVDSNSESDQEKSDGNIRTSPRLRKLRKE